VAVEELVRPLEPYLILMCPDHQPNPSPKNLERASIFKKSVLMRSALTNLLLLYKHKQPILSRRRNAIFNPSGARKASKQLELKPYTGGY